MRSLQDQMFLAVDELSFPLCVRSPEHKNEVFAFFIECRDSRVGQFFPTFPLVTSGFVCLDGECSVEQEDALFRPTAKIAGGRNRRTEVTVYLLIYIREGRGYLYALRNGERESHGLSGFVVRVLSDDDDSYAVERT